MSVESPPTLIELTLLQKKRVLQLSFENGERFSLSAEYLRIHSPSAETRGHGNTPLPLLENKENVNIISIEPIGNYAVKLHFDDGHNTGIYSFETLYELGLQALTEQKACQ